jgi:hypothetical protein
MIDKYDIKLLEHLLNMAKCAGTDKIKIVSAPFPWDKGVTSGYLITIFEEKNGQLET